MEYVNAAKLLIWHESCVLVPNISFLIYECITDYYYGNKLGRYLHPFLNMWFVRFVLRKLIKRFQLILQDRYRFGELALAYERQWCRKSLRTRIIFSKFIPRYLKLEETDHNKVDNTNTLKWSRIWVLFLLS